MIVDSHEHIMYPAMMQLEKMDAAGVDKTILFCSAPHPEKANNLTELEYEMNVLYRILSGANSKESHIRRLETQSLMSQKRSRNILIVSGDLVRFPWVLIWLKHRTG